MERNERNQRKSSHVELTGKYLPIRKFPLENQTTVIVVKARKALNLGRFNLNFRNVNNQCVFDEECI